MSDSQRSADADQSAIQAGRRLHEAGWRETYQVDQQLDAWRRLVDQVERGTYTMTIDDYTNDLAVREWLELARPMLAEPLRRQVDHVLEPLDQRFRRATVEPAKRLPGCSGDWWCRLPVLLSGELAEDAHRMSLKR